MREPALLSARKMNSPAITPSSIIGSVEGRPVYAFTIANRNGLQARIMELGATLLELHAPDREGRLADIVLGESGVEAYLAARSYMGAICGRYGNRIAGGRFTLDDTAYQLSCNDGRNHEHGGFLG